MGSGYRVFTAGEVLTASNVQNYLQDQAVMVFAGTAARTSAIGTANFEEGMLTYLTDVDKLQVYTGSSFADVYPPAATSQGLTLINTTSFSGVSSQSVSDVFSATYDNYKLVINVESPGNPVLGIRMRVSGADNSSAIYNSQLLKGQDSTASASRAVNQTSFPIGTVQVSQRNVAIVELNNPFAAIKTTMTSTMGLDFYELFLRTNFHDTATSYTGFTLVLSGSTITGKVSVYGYNQ